MQNYLIYLWHAPKRHANHKFQAKSQFGFLKIVEIKAKSDERQKKLEKHFKKCEFPFNSTAVQSEFAESSFFIE